MRRSMRYKDGAGKKKWRRVSSTELIWRICQYLDINLVYETRLWCVRKKRSMELSGMLTQVSALLSRIGRTEVCDAR